MKLKTTSALHVLETVILLALLVFLLFWRMRVGLTRFFDVDEFTHLHWAANIARGERPYIDFFTFFTPGFYWTLTPLFWIFRGSTSLFLASRWVMLVTFSGILLCVGSLFGLLRSWRYALIPAILLAFLPMPYDKFLEIRPDNVATLLGLMGIVFEVCALLNLKPRYVRYFWIVSGACYSVSLIVLVKTLPFAGIGLLVAFLAWIWTDRKGGKIYFLSFLLGCVVPIGMVLLWLLTLGHFSLVLYSLGKMAFEANQISRVYAMEPHLFFFPNGSFYGGWGVTTGLILNHAIWAAGAVFGVLRFFTPFVSANGDRRRVLAEVLLSTVFVLSVVGYVNFFPLKHSQYLIPIAIFIAFYCADAMVVMFGALERRGWSIAVIALVCIFAFVIWKQTIYVNEGKLAGSNAEQLKQVRALQEFIPGNAEVFDLEGRMIYWKDPYYICCLPMGSFTRFLSRQPPPIHDILEARHVMYIFQGTTNRFSEFSAEDLSYIHTHYTMVQGWGDGLWIRNDKKL